MSRPLVEHVPQHLGGHHDDRRLAVDRVVARQQADGAGPCLRRRDRRTSGSTAPSAAWCRRSCRPERARARSRTRPPRSSRCRSARRRAPTCLRRPPRRPASGTRPARTGTARRTPRESVMPPSLRAGPAGLATPRQPAGTAPRKALESVGERLGRLEVRQMPGAARDRPSRRPGSRSAIDRLTSGGIRVSPSRGEHERRHVDRAEVGRGVGPIGHALGRRRDRRRPAAPAIVSLTVATARREPAVPSRGGGSAARKPLPSARSRAASARRSPPLPRYRRRPGVGEHEPGDPRSSRAPELEGDVATHRETAHDRALDTRVVERLAGTDPRPRPSSSPAPTSGLPPNPGRSGATTGHQLAELVGLASPHACIHRERVDEQHTIGRRSSRSSDPLRSGPTTTGRAPGITSKDAGSGPTCSPSAYTCRPRFASIVTLVARAIRTFG